MGIGQGSLGLRPVEFEAMKGEPSRTKGPCQGRNIDLEISYIVVIAEVLGVRQSSKERH